MTASRDARMGGSILRALDRALYGVEFATAVIGGGVVFLMMFVGVAEIFLRKVFNSPLYGQLDLIEQTMATYAILTISYCYRKAGHIRVEILAQHYKGRGRWIAEFGTALAALALITAIWPGVLHFFQNAWEIGDSTINTQWPTWPSKFVPVIGFSILWLRILLELWAYARMIADPDGEQIAVPTHPSVIEEATR
jgi:TRAP-type C4-dicarboxylate transport system permease small subunit